MSIKKTIRVFGICALAVLACVLLYRYDNKYTAAGARGFNGVLLLDESDVHKRTFLIDGWAVYGGMLLSPEDFSQSTAPAPVEYVFIGQHGGFEKLTGSPHGSATYRLVIGIPEERRGFMLELPEIFSSCRVYVNGKEALALGETDPGRYRFETGNKVISFEAGGKIDLIVACSDFSNLYSGMVYPPALGPTDAISHMRDARLTLRSAILAAALIIGAASLSIGLLGGHEGIAVLYGFLCLLFAGYTCYPIAMTLTHGSVMYYAAEKVSFCTMLLVVIALQNRLPGPANRMRSIFPVAICAVICGLALLMPFILPRAGLPLIRSYSNLIMAYEWAAAGYITVISGLAWKKHPSSEPVFFGMLVLDCCLVMDRLLPGFEPILTGWFPEIGSFVVVLSVGVAAAREIVHQYHENAMLDERVRIIVSSGLEHYQKMNEMYDKISIMRHDYKYHLSVIRGLRGQDEITRYLDDMEIRASEDELQIYCSNSVINALLVSYSERCAKLCIHYSVQMALPERSAVPDYEMCIILGNLLENAVEACQKLERGRRIEVVCKPADKQLALMVRNSFDGVVVYDGSLPASAKTNGGLGLRSVKTVAARYNGELITEWNDKTFTAYLLMESRS